MTNPAGPVFAGGRFEKYITTEAGEEYTILFLPDLRNDALQREGKPAYYYYVPEQVRFARLGERGDFKFHHTHFVGVFGQDTHVGLGNSEVVGGVLSFTITSRYPTSVMAKALEWLRQECVKKDDPYWRLRGTLPPQIAICPIISNETSVSNLSPDAAGNPPGGASTAPATTPGGTSSGGTSPGGTSPAGGGTTPAGGGMMPAPGSGGDTALFRNRIDIQPARMPRRVPHGASFRAPSNLDAWAWKLQGQGQGSITGGENAFSGLLGAIPSELVWAGFHGSSSPLHVTQRLQLAVWSELVHLKITGNWDRIFQHFSAAAKLKAYWFSADIQAEFNNLRTSGGIKVELSIDGTSPNAAKLEEEINKRIDLVYKKFEEAASKMIFEPAPPTVTPAQAQASGGIFNWGAAFALKYRRDSTRLNLHYEETRNMRYLQPHTISSSLGGFFNEIKRDPAAEKKYFTRLVLGDLSRKVSRIVRPEINWGGDPIGAVSGQIGYPGSQGEIQWTGHLFQNGDAWAPVFAERKQDEVKNAPAGWKPDMTFRKRTIHFKQPPRESDSPYSHVFVEKPDVALDPEPNGTLSNDHNIIVRLEEAGLLDVGPISLDLILQDNTQQVDIEFKAAGRTHDGRERAVTRFSWKYDDQNTPRIWKIFTGQKDYVPLYQYRVTCIVKGSFFSKGMTWMGPWIDGAGNGPLTITIPGPEDAGVTKRSLTVREMFSDGPVLADQPETPAQLPAQPATGPGMVAPPTDGFVMEAPPTDGVGLTPPAQPSNGATSAAQDEHLRQDASPEVAGFTLEAPEQPMVAAPPTTADVGSSGGLMPNATMPPLPPSMDGDSGQAETQESTEDLPLLTGEKSWVEV